MNCIFCGKKAAVKDSVNHRKDVYRKRKCTSCGAVFYTMEKPIPATDEGMRFAFKERYSPEKNHEKWARWYYKDKAKRESSNDLENNS